MTNETNNGRASDDGAQFAPPQVDTRITAADTAPTPVVAAPDEGQGGSRWMMSAVVVVTVVVLAAASLWLVTRGGDEIGNDTDASAETATLGGPRDPRLFYSIPGAMSVDEFPGAPRVTGALDDFYIGESGARDSTVTRYVRGKPQWKVTVGQANVALMEDWDGTIVVGTFGREFGGDTELVRINPDDGSTMWSIRSPGSGTPVYLDGRFYVMEYGGFVGETDDLVEFDLDSGKELKRITDADFLRGEGGFIMIDSDASTAQKIDPDLEAVGEPVEIELSASSDYPWVVEETPDGLVYLAGKAVGLSWEGDTEFECRLSLYAPDSAFIPNESTLVVTSHEAVEVFDIDGSTCETRWRKETSDTTLVSGDDNAGGGGDYLVFATFDDFENDPSATELVDLKTGEVVAASEGDLWLDGGGAVATMDGNSIVAHEIDDGTELWRIETSERAHFRLLNGMVIVTTINGSSATIDIYGD